MGPTGPVAGMYLAGNPDFIALPNGDKLGSRNLTNDATGLKNRTDAEIKDMFLNGTRPSATGMEPLNPVMPYYVFHNMTDEDANAIVAYLRTVPAVDQRRSRARGQLRRPRRRRRAIHAAMIPMPAETYPEQASALRGRYLSAQAGVCIECHTKHLAPGSPTVLDETKLFAGGEDFSALFAAHAQHHAGLEEPHLAPDQRPRHLDGRPTSSRSSSRAEAKDGTGICPPMPVGPKGAFGGLTDADVTDIANYIKSLPADRPT